MKKYEVIVVFDPSLSDSDIKENLSAMEEVLSASGSKLLEKDLEKLGKRETCHNMDKKVFGIYVVIDIEANNEGVSALNRSLYLNSKVMRSMLMKKGRYPLVISLGRGEEDDSGYVASDIDL